MKHLWENNVCTICGIKRKWKRHPNGNRFFYSFNSIEWDSKRKDCNKEIIKQRLLSELFSFVEKNGFTPNTKVWKKEKQFHCTRTISNFFGSFEIFLKSAGLFSENKSYSSIHAWLSRHFKKPSRCEKCLTTKFTRLEWALKKGFAHSRKRENYFAICVPCHRKYDMTDETRQKISTTQTGKQRPKARKPVIMLTANDKFYKEFPSISEAANSTKINGISGVLCGRSKTAGGFKWKYK